MMKILILISLLISSVFSATCTNVTGGTAPEPNCADCTTADDKVCQQCDDGYTLEADNTCEASGSTANCDGTACLAAGGQMCKGDVASAECKPLPSCASIANCDACNTTAGSEAKCGKCAANKLLSVAGDVCGDACPTDEISNGAASPVCVACPSGTDACTAGQECAYVGSAAVCQKHTNCTSKTNCTECVVESGAAVDKCKTCEDNTKYALISDACVACASACASGEVCDVDATDATKAACKAATCLDTITDCSECNDPDDQKCKTCATDFTATADMSKCLKCTDVDADGNCNTAGEVCVADGNDAVKCGAAPAEASSGLLLSAIALISAIVLA